MELLPFGSCFEVFDCTPYHLTSTVIRIHIRANIITIPTTRTARRRVIPITACKQVPVNFVTFNLHIALQRGCSLLCDISGLTRRIAYGVPSQDCELIYSAFCPSPHSFQWCNGLRAVVCLRLLRTANSSFTTYFIVS